MSPKPPSATALRVAELSQGSENVFALRPEKDRLAQIAQELDLSALRKLSFEGKVSPLGRDDWELTGTLGATVVQPCVVTLEPVTTRVDTQVVRRYLADYVEPEEPEVEMPEDDTSEPLGAWIDPGAVMIEALALSVPDYPRAEGAELGAVVHTEPGQKPMTDEDAKPFAGLADLKAKLDREDP
ncbi:hypothetical protein BOO69_10190 [Sulfitobacter alexandrii]|uniref:DUF177 domain-containing protein n=1 Tax=Sulfitobacter alexandrii TaxID=1917485 RepID=A0A1J0WHD2_9RHOB|nr:DUF177 domain-containing protein [Sulfitobacter alexandrii]APE43741.1 hypothetical protein BOO69_10190 [Sulfitobacter alexandrii]